MDEFIAGFFIMLICIAPILVFGIVVEIAKLRKFIDGMKDKL